MAVLSRVSCADVMRARVSRGEAADDVAAESIAAALALVGPGERDDVLRRAQDRVADLPPEARRVADSLDMGRSAPRGPSWDF